MRFTFCIVIIHTWIATQLNSQPIFAGGFASRYLSRSRSLANTLLRFLFAGLLGLALSVEHANSQQLNLTAAQIKGAGIVTAKPESLDQVVKEITLNGTFVNSRTGSIAVTSLDSATITEILTDNLTTVKAGEPLLRLASEPWLRYQQEHVQNSTALNLAQQALGRDKMLFEDGLISRRRFQDTQGQLIMANAVHQNSRQRLKLMGASNIEIAQLEKSGHITATLLVRAPAAGSVSGMTWMPGQQVTSGSQLLQITKPSGLELLLNASVEQSSYIKPGQTVRLKACNDQVLPLGNVLGVGNELTVSNQVIPVRVKLKSNPQALACYKLNQFVNASVETAQEKDKGSSDFKVPDTAVAHIGSQAYIFAKSASGFKAIPVNAKRLSSNSFAINADSKLNSDDSVAVSGTVLLKGVLQGLGSE